jgi:NAD dependent epimerase/dehydratase family enzyme
LLLNGSKISSGKITATGYNFQFPDVDSALTNCITNNDDYK